MRRSRYKHYAARSKPLDLYLPQRLGHNSMVTDFSYSFGHEHVIITTSNDPGAAQAGAELAAAVKGCSHLEIGDNPALPFTQGLVGFLADRNPLPSAVTQSRYIGLGRRSPNRMVAQHR